MPVDQEVQIVAHSEDPLREIPAAVVQPWRSIGNWSAVASIFTKFEAQISS
jgi:hypothetical protein